MSRKPVVLGVLVWVLVVTAVSGVTWAVIEGAGQGLLSDDAVTETQPVPTTALPSPSTRSPGPDEPESPDGTARTWEGRPGLVTVRCVGQRPRFESATPSNGYRFEVEQEGEGELEVKFESATREFKVTATCTAEGPRYAVEADDS